METDEAFDARIIANFEIALQAEVAIVNTDMRVPFRLGRPEFWQDFRLAQPLPESCILAIDRKMALQDKFKSLADRAKSIPAALEGRADKLHARLNDVETRGHGAFSKMEGVLEDAEKGVQAAEDAVNQLTNGGPPLDSKS